MTNLHKSCSKLRIKSETSEGNRQGILGKWVHIEEGGNYYNRLMHKKGKSTEFEISCHFATRFGIPINARVLFSFPLGGSFIFCSLRVEKLLGWAFVINDCDCCKSFLIGESNLIAGRL